MAGEGDLRGRIFISETPGQESIRIGSRWFELHTREFGDLRLTIRQLEMRGIITQVHEDTTWKVDPTMYRRILGD